MRGQNLMNYALLQQPSPNSTESNATSDCQDDPTTPVKTNWKRTRCGRVYMVVWSFYHSVIPISCSSSVACLPTLLNIFYCYVGLCLRFCVLPYICVCFSTSLFSGQPRSLIYCLPAFHVMYPSLCCLSVYGIYLSSSLCIPRSGYVTVCQCPVDFPAYRSACLP